jgi:hypothetical protein
MPSARPLTSACATLPHRLSVDLEERHVGFLVPIEGGLGRAAGTVHVVLAFREDQAAACWTASMSSRRQRCVTARPTPGSQPDRPTGASLGSKRGCARERKSGSQQTPRWREMDSNYWSRHEETSLGRAMRFPRTAPPARRGTDPERDEKFESGFLQQRV